MVGKWHPALDLTKELNMLAPVWVRLLSLPLEYWDERVLKSIGNSFGHFVVVDLVTLHKSRLVFVRFSVNVVIGATLPESIVLSSKWGKKI